LAQTSVSSLPTPPDPWNAVTASRTRIAIVDDDRDLVALLRDIFGETHDVRAVGGSRSVGSISDEAPDILVIGLLGAATGAALSGWDLVALARQHRDLRNVPIILLTADLASVMADGDRLARYSDLHVVEVPFDEPVIETVVSSIDRRTRDSRTSGQPLTRARSTVVSAMTDASALDRLPALCAHGHASGDGDGLSGGCTRCS
jgi:DNA-binding response OmpR family regulator